MESDSRKAPVAKRPRTGEHPEETNKNADDCKGISIPTFDIACLNELSSDEFLEAYSQYQAVHFKVGPPEKEISKGLTWKSIGSIYEELNKVDKQSWCIENRGDNQEKDLTSQNLLAPQTTNDRAYCSFLVQKDKKAYERLLKRLPLENLSSAIDAKWSYEPCLWIFFGRNPTTKEPLEGRGLHTDSVSHDGTWHYQLSGTKEWFISPSCDLLNHWKKHPIPQTHWGESTKLQVVCQQGDVLVVNTRLWFHRTVIPAQAYPSVSYARDFRITTQYQNGVTKASMTNLDGLYARNDIEAGTIIFTEADMPDCELHRSKDNPNCEVVELEDGTGAVVSKRAIACGEFFCAPESSDEEEEEEEFVEEDE